MQKKTKFLSMLLVLVMMLTVLTACAPAAPAEPAPVEPAPVEEPAEEPEEPAEPALVPEDVLKEAAVEFLNSIPDDMITKADVALALKEENPDAVFWVDLRSAEDYATGHITGAVNIPYGKVGEHLDVLPMNKQIIFQCYSGQTSAQVAAIANILGFKAVSFFGGMKFGWTPLELGQDTLEMEANELPEAKMPELDEKGQILWDAAKAYFKEGENFIISPEDLNAIVEENPDAVTVLSIRRLEDYQAGHIPTAIHIPYKEVGANIDTIPMNRPVYVYCYTGQTAGVTIGAMRMMGYNAISMSRGTAGWEEAGFELVTE